jgi:hypothetical protein
MLLLPWVRRKRAIRAGVCDDQRKRKRRRRQRREHSESEETESEPELEEATTTKNGSL